MSYSALTIPSKIVVVIEEKCRNSTTKKGPGRLYLGPHKNPENVFKYVFLGGGGVAAVPTLICLKRK